MKRKWVERGRGEKRGWRWEEGWRREGAFPNLERGDYYPICRSDLHTVLFYWRLTQLWLLHQVQQWALWPLVMYCYCKIVVCIDSCPWVMNTHFNNCYMHTEVFQIVHIVYLLPWLYCGQQSLKALLACLHTSMHGIVLSTDIYFPCKHTHTHTHTHTGTSRHQVLQKALYSHSHYGGSALWH